MVLQWRKPLQTLQLLCRLCLIGIRRSSPAKIVWTPRNWNWNTIEWPEFRRKSSWIFLNGAQSLFYPLTASIQPHFSLKCGSVACVRGLPNPPPPLMSRVCALFPDVSPQASQQKLSSLGIFHHLPTVIEWQFAQSSFQLKAKNVFRQPHCSWFLTDVQNGWNLTSLSQYRIVCHPSLDLVSCWYGDWDWRGHAEGQEAGPDFEAEFGGKLGEERKDGCAFLSAPVMIGSLHFQ